MFKKLDNGQILHLEKEDTYELWTPFGMIKQVRQTTIETKNVYQWMIFDLESECYVEDSSNTATIFIEGVEYIPINGKVELDI